MKRSSWNKQKVRLLITWNERKLGGWKSKNKISLSLWTSFLVKNAAVGETVEVWPAFYGTRRLLSQNPDTGTTKDSDSSKRCDNVLR